MSTVFYFCLFVFSTAVISFYISGYLYWRRVVWTLECSPCPWLLINFHKATACSPLKSNCPTWNGWTGTSRYFRVRFSRNHQYIHRYISRGFLALQVATYLKKRFLTCMLVFGSKSYISVTEGPAFMKDLKPESPSKSLEMHLYRRIKNILCFIITWLSLLII